MKAATALTSVLFLVLLVSVASATTGYFESGAAGINPSCTQSEPCADPFAYLSNNTFDEYLLASGEYTVDSAVVLTKPFTLRKWRERDENEPVVLTSFGSKLFYLDMQQPLTGSVTWSFQDIIMQCSNGYAIDMFDGGDGQAHLELHNVTIRNSGGGVIVWNHMLETNNLIISNISCQSGEPLAVLYSNWTFTDVTLLNNCLGGDYVSVAYVAGTEESTYFCAIPCNSSECDCNHLPLVSWNVSSELLDLTSSEAVAFYHYRIYFERYIGSHKTVRMRSWPSRRRLH
ncbi:hypothetical protein QOT17_025039 [Balamuthia mandrillaris]